MTDQTQPDPQPTALARNRMQEIREDIGGGAPTALVPRTVGEVQALAGMLATSALVPAGLRDRPADVAMMILTGAELAMGPASALRLLYVDRNGIPRLMAGGKSALVRRARVCVYLKPDPGNNAERATWRAKRVGEEEVVMTYTAEQARAAGFLPGKPESAWSKHPARMLSARAKAWLCDDVFPDVVAGLYEGDEIETYEPEAVPAFSAPAAPEKPKRERAKKTDTSDVVDAEIVPSSEAPAATQEQTLRQKQIADAEAAKAAAFAKAKEGATAIQNGRDEKSAAGKYPEPTGTGAATATPTTVASAAPVASVASDDDFGDAGTASPIAKLGPINCETLIGTDGKAYSNALAGHDAQANFAKFVSEVSAATAETIETVKREWIPWSKQNAAGAAFAPQMRDAFAKKKTELGG